MKHKATGREIAREIEIAASGETFSIVRAYEREAEALGFNMGSMCGSDPRGLSREYVCIAKWRNLGTRRDRKTRSWHTLARSLH